MAPGNGARVPIGVGTRVVVGGTGALVNGRVDPGVGTPVGGRGGTAVGEFVETGDGENV